MAVITRMTVGMTAVPDGEMTIEHTADTALDRLGRWMARRLNRPSAGYHPYTPSDYESLCRTLEPGDVLLVEGRERISNAIKYLTQSTWSHAAMFVGDRMPKPEDGSERPRLVEVTIEAGCAAAPLSKYARYNTRICRARGLGRKERQEVVEFMVGRIGLRYDMRNILDLLRYFFPTPPVPVRWRRRMIAFGSGDPTRAICSSLIAQAYQSVAFPILPEISVVEEGEGSAYSRREIYHIRNSALFAPRDFDLSPWFEIVKPPPGGGIDYRSVPWSQPAPLGVDGG